jgi:catechol-2,3-dioxygenase
MQRPTQHLGLHHLALTVNQLEKCTQFYTQILGMEIEWQPDEDNIYLTSGSDNLAIHRSETGQALPQTQQRLDHLGFILPTPEAVDAWYEYMQAHGVSMKTPVKTHRDGAKSFYCADPDGNIVQMIYHPPLVSE